ncbi:MAG TPA: hypothetical protein VME42_09045 [Steroidobacteraceae bacterium]|nr:hypothetical protein [Steroidobacteraceae bacterium]
MSGASLGPAAIDFVRGDATGVLIPAHVAALRAGGEAFLTQALRIFGSLSRDNRVARITRVDGCAGGSTGQKLLLSVEYQRPEAGLHTDLFVKFSRDFGDPIRDNRGKHEMESETRFAAVSRLPGFPITVPAAYFADYHRDSGTGLLITERIAFGTGGIEPHHEKCLDHELTDPLAHYEAIVSALARIAAAHKSQRLGPDIDARFPFDPAAAAARDPICHDERRLHALVAQYGDFAARCPGLLPPAIVSRAFIEKLDREVGLFLEHQRTIKRFLQADPDFIALCHWNAHIDNAWFWRDASDRLQCGLFDWGHVGQMNVAFALWGCLSAAPLEIWRRHLESLLGLFVRELCDHGGPRLDVAGLKLRMELHAAMMGLAYFLESPARILFRLPEAAGASGPLDPVFRKSETARNNLHILAVLMSFWQTHDFGATLERLLAGTADPPGQGSHH